MRPSRALSLKREALAQLDTDEMREVAGGTHIGCGVTHGNTSCDFCPTVPINQCIVLTPVILTLPLDQCIQIDLTNACVGITQTCM